jgi:hypothetical protein
VYNLYEFAKFAKVISSYNFSIVCWMCEIHFIIFYIALFVFIPIKCVRVYVRSSGKYIVIATNILLIAARVECFRTTGTRYAIITHCQRVVNFEVQNTDWLPHQIRYINVT